MKKKIQLGKKEYYDKMYACWLGKNIGGTLGAPYEVKKHVNDLTFYSPVPQGSAPNDDLDLQLVWLKLLEDKAALPELEDIAGYWKKFSANYPWDEYGFCARNLERGLLPPVSGCFENFFIDNMGSPIRSEIWACLFPANPQAAAVMAWKDSAMDHSGGQGTYGEMFWAAVESAAFVESDPEILIKIGLEMIPGYTEISRVIRDAVWCYKNGIRWADARNKLAECYGGNHGCHAVPNHGFTILGWLYGKDFGDKLCKAVNCGYDTDCTGATLGSVLGIIGGRKGIPKKWLAPIGEKIVLHKLTGKCGAPKNVKELSGRMLKIAEKFEGCSASAGFGKRTVLPKDLRSLLFKNEEALKILKTDPQSSIVVRKGFTITLHYNGDPVILPGIRKTLRVSVAVKDVPVNAGIELKAPKGWQVLEGNSGETGSRSFELLTRNEQGRNIITVVVNFRGQKASADFMLFGSEEAKGFEPGRNVRSCKNCGRRIIKCTCKKSRILDFGLVGFDQKDFLDKFFM